MSKNVVVNKKMLLWMMVLAVVFVNKAIHSKVNFFATEEEQKIEDFLQVVRTEILKKPLKEGEVFTIPETMAIETSKGAVILREGGQMIVGKGQSNFEKAKVVYDLSGQSFGKKTLVYLTFDDIKESYYRQQLVHRSGISPESIDAYFTKKDGLSQDLPDLNSGEVIIVDRVSLFLFSWWQEEKRNNEAERISASKRRIH